jgi:hypothetical protein
MITPHASPPVAPEQEGSLPSSWYWQGAQDAADQVHADLAMNLHSGQVMASHGCVPSEAAHVAAGATAPPGF